MSDVTAWLIEFGSPAIYFCNDGDWCGNANHAHKFPTAEQANMKMASMQSPMKGEYRVVEHMWQDVPVAP